MAPLKINAQNFCSNSVNALYLNLDLWCVEVGTNLGPGDHFSYAANDLLNWLDQISIR